MHEERMYADARNSSKAPSVEQRLKLQTNDTLLHGSNAEDKEIRYVHTEVAGEATRYDALLAGDTLSWSYGFLPQTT